MICFSMVYRPPGFGIGALVSERGVREPLHLHRQIPLLFVKEGLPVGYEILQVPKLRSIDRGVIDLCHNAVPHRELAP